MDAANGWTAANHLWEFLTQDVAIVGVLSSPMLSWIGMAGILAMCCWHGAILLRGACRIRQALCRVQSQVSSLLRARRRWSTEWIVTPTLGRTRPLQDESKASRCDLDDLNVLDRALRAERAFAVDWLSYRKTFSIEQSAWFVEPTVSAQKSAAEFFSFEASMAEYLNIGFYRQLPSFLTGMGLMFTFLAILIGLSKLHANGSQVEGIEGLINGLSGKFVTSIAGLACSNAFTLLENSVWYRLSARYRRCLSLLDEVFPQRIVDQHAQPSAGRNGYVSPIVSPTRNDNDKQVVDVVHHQLGTTVAALTKVSESLTAMSATQRGSMVDDLPREIGHEVHKALKRVVQPLADAIQDLNRTMKGQAIPVQLSKSEMETIFQKLKTHGATIQTTPSVKTGNSVNSTPHHE
ncbi:MAG: hypothetical protein JSR31_11385 [Nitrospira sp.]|nr:hypothetical protein [Nitrospira sp.]